MTNFDGRLYQAGRTVGQEMHEIESSFEQVALFREYFDMGFSDEFALGFLDGITD